MNRRGKLVWIAAAWLALLSVGPATLAQETPSPVLDAPAIVCGPEFASGRTIEDPKVLERLKVLAIQGDAEAAERLFEYHAWHSGDRSDPDTNWLAVASKNGSVSAMRLVAESLLTEQLLAEGPRDCGPARKLLLRALEKSLKCGYSERQIYLIRQDLADAETCGAS